MPLNSGATTGGISPLDPWSELISRIGSSRLRGLYDVQKNLVATSAGLTSWDDVRGSSGFGPTILPLGATGAGNTGPKLSGVGPTAVLVSDSSVSSNEWAATASAFDMSSNPLALIFVGEVTGGALVYPMGFIDTLSGGSSNFFLYHQISSTQMGLDVSGGGSWSMSSKTVQPGAGKRILLIGSSSGSVPWYGAPYRRFEMVGRGMDLYASGGNQAAVNIHFVLGGWAGFTGAPGVVKTRAIIMLSSVPTSADRAAIEAFVTRGNAGHVVTLAPSTHYVCCIGDSITEGVHTAVTQTDRCPSGPTAGSYPSNTGPYPSVIQALCIGAGKSVDVMNSGVGGRSISEFLDIVSPQTTNMFSDMLAALSSTRVAAGFNNIAIVSIGSNDLYQSRAGAQIYTDITTAVGMIRAAGGKAVVCTVTPRNDFFGTAKETQRLALNTAIRGNAIGADIVVDFATAAGGVFADPTASGAAGSNTTGDPTSSSTYYFSDQIHPLDAGTAIMGNMVYGALVSSGLI